MTIHKYSGAGNSFVMLDSRTEGSLLSVREITSLCREHSTDGLVLLRASSGHDFRMEFHNPDGSSGMMCGNGGRCITLFADRLGIEPSNGEYYEFEAPDGIHRAWIKKDDGESSVIKLSMKYPEDIVEIMDGHFTDTGARHFVKMVPDVNAVDVEKEGRRYRSMKEFFPQGTNVDFVQILSSGSIRVRTFEKGVEAETLSCGTGVTASAFVYDRLLGRKTFPAEVSVSTATATFIVEINSTELFLSGPVGIIY